MTGIVIVEVRPRSQVRPDEQDRDADEEPREQAEVAQPHRRREDPREGRRVDLDDGPLGRLGLRLRGRCVTAA